jgi:hypothetical protein
MTNVTFVQDPSVDPPVLQASPSVLQQSAAGSPGILAPGLSILRLQVLAESPYLEYQLQVRGKCVGQWDPSGACR